MVLKKKVKSNLIIKGELLNGYSKGEKMVLQKLENFTNKDIIKEEAEILTNLLDDITKIWFVRKPLIKLGS